MGQEIIDLVSEDATIKKKFDNVGTITAVGLQTAVSAVGVTNGFNLIHNSWQLVSYAGLEVIQKQLIIRCGRSGFTTSCSYFT